MKRHYGRTFVGLALVLVVIAAGAAAANAIAAEAKARYSRLRDQDQVAGAARRTQMDRLQRLRIALEPVTAFSAAWRAAARLPEKDAAERIRSEIEAIAQRQLGLVTDNAITPQPDRYAFQGAAMRVQRVALRASGKDLTALMTWLGKVEERYPAAVIEWCDFASNVGGSTGLTIRLVQPLAETAGRRLPAPAVLEQSMLSPDAIGAVAWPRYVPAAVKSPIPVGFRRNPLQPVVAGEIRAPLVIHDETDEISPRIEAALTGRIRSVVRGDVPIVVIDGRVFRVGDEVVVGAGRDRPIVSAQTRLKEIGPDRLIFHVAGGTLERPIQCSIAYALPEFLKAR